MLVWAAVAYYVMRVWTYVFYVPGRLEIAARPLSAEDLDWFQRTLAIDYRPVLVAAVLTLFIAAAFVPAASTPQDPARTGAGFDDNKKGY
jgi:hypothetical protein